ncbi:uncharacterized protein METZ01_LOCUS490224, partial [marine metagenome]
MDSDTKSVETLREAIPPIMEPNLDFLIQEGIQFGNLRFTNDKKLAATGAEVLWVTHDTPVDEDDQADVEFVFKEVSKVLPFLEND